MAAIPAWLGDAAKSEGRPTRLKLASELLQVETGRDTIQKASPLVFKLALVLRQAKNDFNYPEDKYNSLQAIWWAAPAD